MGDRFHLHLKRAPYLSFDTCSRLSFWHCACLFIIKLVTVHLRVQGGLSKYMQKREFVTLRTVISFYFFLAQVRFGAWAGSRMDR